MSAQKEQVPQKMSSSPNKGLLLVNKISGKSSFYPIMQVRKRTGIKKVGHAGTLDPFASGLLLLLVGKEYTKLQTQFLSMDKEYEALVHLGKSTDSYDVEGKELSTSDKKPSLEELQKALEAFQGSFLQTPPMFSAKKVKGKKLYELARKGIEIERKSVLVQATTTLLSYEYPFVRLHIHCSKGTYIRSIANDLGNMLDCGAYLHALTRTKIGPFSIEDALSSAYLNEEEYSLAPYLKTKAELLQYENFLSPPLSCTS